MRIVYDESKRRLNIKKHGYDFADLTDEFFGTARTKAAKKDRLIAVGEFRGRVITVIFRPLGTEAVSIVSVRRASGQERMIL